ncbi:IS5 family transposase (plasmid) [Paracoccus liaowanqingii]|uniref:IS5 family transposase n=1 Tax=Paracoccus liaowanqingii TaxID=2560053 RepID=A0A4Y5SQT4_9RHOB|nr:IS5 family transposase [Paracoccus liaowanqingii]QDA35709.1 IS5 family transposase [Paracoccus liaowanqingii]
MTKPEPASYRTTNWKSYKDALKQHGSLLIWLDKDMAWMAIREGRPGHPPVFSDAAVYFCLMVKVLFGLPLRQMTGMVTSILAMARLDWPLPDFSTHEPKAENPAVQIPHRCGQNPLNLLVDSTGIKFLGDGGKHGTHRRHQYRKVHMAMDTATGDIRAVEFTSSREGDSPVLPDLLHPIPPDEQIGTVTGDGAFDIRRRHTAIVDRVGTFVIPIRRNGRLRKEDCAAARARNDILRASKCFGRANWKHWFGYHVRSRIEAKMRCLKSFGERIASRDPDRQGAEVHIRVALMNRFNALGTAEIRRVA